MAGGGSIDTNEGEEGEGGRILPQHQQQRPSCGGDGPRRRRPLSLLISSNDAMNSNMTCALPGDKLKESPDAKKKNGGKATASKKEGRHAFRRNQQAKTSPFRTPPPHSRSQTSATPTTMKTTAEEKSTPKGRSNTVGKTPKSAPPANNKSQCNPSFFSPPRALRQPPLVPFLSPTTPSYKDFPGTEDVRLLRSPLLTLRYAWEGLYGSCLRNVRVRWPLGRRASVLLISSLVAAGAAIGNALGGGYGQNVRLVTKYWVDAISEAAFWFGCGFLSTAGLGSGVQTGALVLFPHVCGLALAWADSNSNSYDRDELADVAAGGGGDQQRYQPLSDLLWSVAIPGFWSGTGSAAGELVPYILARVIRAAGGDPFALLDEDSSSAEMLVGDFDDATDSDAAALSDADTKMKKQNNRPWTAVLLANTRSAMEGQMLPESKHVFVKIFVLAAVPNGLFDLCGLVCGSTGVPFWTFFGAVWSGKALVRTPLQTCGLAACVVAVLSSSRRNEVDGAAAALEEEEEESTPLRAMFMQFGRDAVTKFIRGVDDDDDASSVGNEDDNSFVVTAIKTVWTCGTIWVFAFFLLSTLEQIAQHHSKTLHGGHGRRRCS